MCLEKNGHIAFSNNSNKSDLLSIIFGTKNNQFNFHVVTLLAMRDKNRKPVRIRRTAIIACAKTTLS